MPSRLLRHLVFSATAVALSLLAACGGGAGQGGAAAVPNTTNTTDTTTTASGAPAVDSKHIPVGDGKLSSTAPKVGYVYVCTIPTSTNPAGKAPWISSDGTTWDAAAKVKVQGAVSWPFSFNVTAANGSLNISGNGLPDHTTGVFPISATDPAYQYDKNPNTIKSTSIAWGLTANPVVAAQPGCTSLGAIGVLLTGARIFNALDADGRDAGAHEVQDACDGHPQSVGAYHYHSLSSCVKQADTPGAHSPLVGYIADGFGLYGNLGENGKALTNADLDECHGHSHAIIVNGKTIVQYHYHATKEYPYTAGCYKGTPAIIR